MLRTSILDRLCGPLCEAVLLTPAGSGQETLEYLERANLFIVPLDNDRQWYRYHHLFGDLLRKRLGQSLTAEEIAEHHIRASQWYEDHGLELEAFQHAAAANDIERAERLMESKAMPLHFRSAVNADPGVAGVAAEVSAGCQTRVVGEVGHDGADGRPDDGRRRETAGG